jgi:four helix bundle protein
MLLFQHDERVGARDERPDGSFDAAERGRLLTAGYLRRVTYGGLLTALQLAWENIRSPREGSERHGMTFEKLRVYQAAELLDGKIQELIKTLPRGHSKDADQLRRASGSILYNIAEAYGSEYPARKFSFLEISRGSADEARAILRRLVRAHALPLPATYSASHLTFAIAKMLTSWMATLKRISQDTH